MAEAIEQILDRVIGGRDHAAFDELVATGESALPKLIEVLERGPGSAIVGAALARLEVADRVAMLGALARHSNRRVRDAAIRGLALTSDPRAVPIIAEVLDSGDHLFTAISALGDLGAPDGAAIVRRALTARVGDPTDLRVLEELSTRAVADGDPSDLFAIAYAAEALAKLADFALISVAIELSRFVPHDGLSEAGQVRLHAIRALDVGIGHEVAAALDAACADPDHEVAEAALRATLHLGRPRWVERWLSVLAGGDEQRAYTAQYCLEQLTGEAVPESWHHAATWWRAISHRFEPATCYRLGRPATPGVLVALAGGRDNAVARMELAQMTGCQFLATELAEAPPSVIAKLDAWWRANSSRFPPGKLHRWGRTYEPDAVD
jgi:hypothetical protein